MTQAEYMQREIVAITPFPLGNVHNGQIRVKFKSAKGETKWMNLSPAQMRAIENLIAMSRDFYGEEA